jgi:hypothetical protein
MENLRLRALRRGLIIVAGVAVTTVTGAPAEGNPIGEIYEGSGYAMAVGPASVGYCQSVAVWAPGGAVSTVPPGATLAGKAVGLSVCTGTVPVSQGVVIEAWRADGGPGYVSKTCPGATMCDVDIPVGWGVVHIMPSSFWVIPNDSAWVLMNNLNNDGYCGTNGNPRDIVCRAWATGMS